MKVLKCGTTNVTAESFSEYYDEWIQYVTSDENPYVSFVDCNI